MTGRFDGKSALITGAANGIGLACAARFAADGAHVVLADIDGVKAQAAAQDLRAQGYSAIAVTCDVTDRADVEAAVAAAVKAFGALDIMVSNAGIASGAPFIDMTDALFDRVIAVNLRSVFIGGQCAARQMIAQKTGGAIINMSSVNAQMAIPGLAAYGASKGGINQLTRVMAVELAPHGIRVNAIGPGTILTELARKAVLGDKASRHKVLSRTPLGRAGEPAESASVAAFLASGDAAYVTGQVIYPDGGRMALNYTVPVADEG